MATALITVSPNTLLPEIIAQITQQNWQNINSVNNATRHQIVNRHSCVLVVEQGKLVGIFTERDVVGCLSSRESMQAIPVEAVMTTPVISLLNTAYKNIFTVLSILKVNQIRHLPVVNERQELIGIIAPETMQAVLHPSNLLRWRTVEEVMRSHVIQATPETSVLELAEMITTHQVGSIIITENSSRDKVSANNLALPIPLGIVSEKDLVRILHHHDNLHNLTAANIMSQPVWVISPQDSLWKAYRQMQSLAIRRLIVTNQQGRMLGIISQRSLLHPLSTADLYEVVENLEEQVYQLEQEKLQLLQSNYDDLEKQVRERTQQLKEQSLCHQLLYEIALHILQTKNLTDIFTDAVFKVRQFLECDRVLIFRCENVWNMQILAESVGEEWPKLIGKLMTDSENQALSNCVVHDNEFVQSNEILVINDIYDIDFVASQIKLLEKIPIRSKVLIPIVHNGELWGFIHASQSKHSRQWQTLEIEWLQKLATQLAIAIHQDQLQQKSQAELRERLRVESEVRYLNAKLEERVIERTAHLNAINYQLQREIAEKRGLSARLQASETELLAVFNAMNDIVLIIDATVENITIAPTQPEFIYDPRKNIFDLTIAQFWQEKQDLFTGVIKETLTSQQTVKFDYKLESGSDTYWFVANISPISQEKVVWVATDITEHKKTELFLAKARDQLESIVDERTAALAEANDILIEEIRERQQAEIHLEIKAKQQEVIAQLSQRALGKTDLDDLFNQAVSLVKDVLSVDFVSIFELSSNKSNLWMRAGMGWHSHIVREVHLGIGNKSQSGYTLESEQPVIVDDLRIETRFRVSELLHNHQVVSGASVVIYGQEKPYGVLAVHTRNSRHFGIDSVNFLQAIANVIGTAVERLQAEAELDHFFNISLDMMSISSINGEFKRINPRFMTNLGYTPTEILGSSWLTLVHPEDRQITRENMEKLAMGLPILDLENRYICADGSCRWLAWTAIPSRTEELIYAVIRDITDRKLAEVAIQESEELHRITLSNISDAVLITDDQGKITFVCPNVNCIFGYSQQDVEKLNNIGELLGKDLFDFHELEQKGELTNIEQNITDCLGEIHAVLINVKKVAIKEGTILYTCRDVTARKQAEDALKESEQRYINLAENVPVGIFRTDIDGQCVYVNQQWQVIAGFATQDAMGYGWSEAIHPDDRQRVRQLWQTVVNTNSRFSAEYRLLNSTGKKRWVLGQATADRDQTGQVTGYVGTITDISDRKGIEETIRQIAEGVSAQTGDAFFQSLVEYLATLLEVDIALVSEIENYPGGRKARTVAIWQDGKIHSNIEYDLTGTPSQQVITEEKLCHFSENIQVLFPDDHLLSMMEAEAYIGTPLLRCAGEPLGLIAVISRKPLLKTTFCDEIMRIFAVRATVELERRDALIALQQLNQELEARVEQRTIALKESQAQLQELFDNANDLIQSVSLVDGHFIYVNRAWQETLGYTEAEISQLSLSDIVPADDWYLFENICQQLQSPQSGVLDRQEVRFLTKKKKLVILEGNLNCRYENDHPTMIRGIFRDITAQKQVQNVIQESEAKYRAMMNDASDGIMLIDQNYQVIEINHKTEDLFGYTALEFGKMSLSHWVLFPPKLQEKAEDLWQLLWRNKSIVWNNTSLLHKLGHSVPVDVTASVIEYAGKRLAQVIIHDITERKRAEEKLQESKQLLQLVIDNIPQMIFWKDRKSVYLGCNENFAKFVGMTEPEKIIGKTDYDLPWKKDDASWYRSCDRRIMKNGQAELHLVETRLFDGNQQSWLDINRIPLHNMQNNQVVGLLVTYEDITERKKIEQRLKLTQFTLDRLGDAVFFVEWDAHIFYANEVACQSLGYERGQILNMTFDQIDPDFSLKEWQSHWRKLRQRKSYTFESVLLKRDGSSIPVEVNMNYLEFNGKEYNCAITRNITARKQSEAELKAAKEQLQAVLEAVPGFIFWVSHDLRYQGVNQNLAQISNLRPEDFIGKPIDFIAPSSEICRFMREFIPNQQQQISQANITYKIEGEIYHYLFIAQKYQKGESAVFVGIDITQRREIEEQLKEALKEKELLLKEIHHRVKNNLLVVSNLLEFQADYTNNPDILKVLKESQNRIQSMALIHEKLYRSPNLEKINFGEYLEDLVDNLFASYNYGDDRIEFEFNIQPIYLNVETANPCGLIVNELLSNTFKHAFPDSRHGKIWVELYEVENHQIILIVRDDGVGFPADLDFQHLESLGMELVCTLTKQIEGEIDLHGDIGTSFCIKFKELNYRKRF